MSLYYIDRKTGQLEKEMVVGEKFLNWMNNTKSGNTLLELLIKKRFCSILFGKLQDLSISRFKIPPFVEKFQIDMSEAKREDITSYNSFNDFFTRELKKDARPISENNNILISPADGRIFAYENINIKNLIQAKDSHYTLEELLCDKSLAEEYNDGTCIVVRLAPTDYHRFHFPDSGIAEKPKMIKGYYYSVNPMTLKKIIQVYCQNKREITVFNSDNFDKIVLVEIGATFVGSIIQTYIPGKCVKKGQEKGFFKFGGSTIIMLLKKGIVNIDEDIIQNTKKGYETKINMGEGIGMKK